jgi:hypothetical protein
MRRRWLRWGLRLLGVGLVALVLATQVEWAELPVLLARLATGIPATAGAILLLVAMVVLTAWRWRILVRALELPMELGAGIRLTFVGAFFNLAVPGSTGGDFVKAWYAARASGAGVKAVVSVFADRAIGLFGLALFAAGALWFGPPHAGYGAARGVAAGVLVGGTALGFLLLSRRVRRGIGLSRLLRRLPFQRVLAEADEALRLYRRRGRTIGIALLVSLVNHAGTAVACWLLAGALGIEGVSLPIALALLPVANLLSAIPLLPGGWGVGELAFAWLFGAVGVPPTEAVTLSVVYRLANLLAGLPGGVLWTLHRDRPDMAEMEREVGLEVDEVARREAAAASEALP